MSLAPHFSDGFPSASMSNLFRYGFDRILTPVLTLVGGVVAGKRHRGAVRDGYPHARFLQESKTRTRLVSEEYSGFDRPTNKVNCRSGPSSDDDGSSPV